MSTSCCLQSPSPQKFTCQICERTCVILPTLMSSMSILASSSSFLPPSFLTFPPSDLSAGAPSFFPPSAPLSFFPPSAPFSFFPPSPPFSFLASPAALLSAAGAPAQPGRSELYTTLNRGYVPLPPEGNTNVVVPQGAHHMVLLRCPRKHAMVKHRRHHISWDRSGTAFLGTDQASGLG